MALSTKILVLIGVSLLSFTAFLDATIVSTGLPALQKSLHMSVTQLQWIMNAFFLGISAFMASMGKIADIYGRWRVFYIGTIVFGLASLGAGFSTHPYYLIAFRALQGMMTAITIPVGVALIQTVFEKHELAKAMGVFSTITGSGLALGPVVGGLLVTAFGWPSIFFVNIPFLVVGFALCLCSVKESPSNKKMNLDYLGILFLALTTGALVFAVVEANNYGWGSSIILTAFGVFVVGLLLLIITESKVSDPIMATALFKNPIFISTMFFLFAGGGFMSIALFISPLYLHLITDETILMTGVILFIMPLIFVLSSPFIAYINDRIGCRSSLIWGALFYLLAGCGYLFFARQLNYYVLFPTFVLFGLGWAIANQVPAVAMGQAIHNDHLTVAIGSLYSFFNIGSAVILAVSVSLFHWKTAQSVSQQLVQQNIQLSFSQQALLNKFVSQPDKLHDISQQITTAQVPMETLLKNAFMAGMHTMFWPIIFFSMIALLAMIFLMGKKEIDAAIS